MLTRAHVSQSVFSYRKCHVMTLRLKKLPLGNTWSWVIQVCFERCLHYGLIRFKHLSAVQP